MTSALADAAADFPPERRLALVDLLDRVLAGGVVIAGEVTLSLAGVDMVRISLRALISSAGALEKPPRHQPASAAESHNRQAIQP